MHLTKMKKNQTNSGSFRDRQLVEVRKGQLKRKYGFTQELYEVFFFMQCGQCAICHEDWDGKRNFAVDHNHITGRVRGLLCHKCNPALGAFKDDPELLIKAAMYLKKYA